MEDKILNPKDIVHEVYDEIKSRWKRGKELSITSLPTLDNILWGLRTQKLVIVGARPSMGKSTYMLQLAYDFAKQGKKVYFFTFEMTPAVCVERLMCSYNRTDNFLMNTGKICEEVNYEKKVKQFTDGFPDSLVIIDQIGRNIKQLIDTIEKLGSDVDVVFIDYIQLIKGIGNRSDKQTLDEYLTTLREYAIRRKFCAIVGSQINRDTHTGAVKPPSMWELKSSGTLEENSDIVILLHWDYFYSRDDTKKNDYWIRIAKNRDGRTGIFDKCRFYPQFYKIAEEPEEDEWIGF